MQIEFLIIEIYKMVGRLCPALRQNCNPPGFGFCSCLVNQDSNKSGLLEDSFDLFILITSNWKRRAFKTDQVVRMGPWLVPLMSNAGNNNDSRTFVPFDLDLGISLQLRGRVGSLKEIK